MLALAILSEELAHSSGGLAITPLVSSYMAGAAPGPLRQRGAEGALAAAAAGGRARRGDRGHRAGRRAPTSPGSRPRRDAVEGGYLLRGTKMFITNAGLADVTIVAAKTDPEAGHRGITTFLVERGAERA